MKPIIFCNIAYMKFYKGVIANIDEPENGGSYVDENNYGHESYNFETVLLDDNSEKCFGFVQIPHTNKSAISELHIEKINGCKLSENEESIDGVTVVWCAKSNRYGETRVVGWYNNATAFRYPQYLEFENGYVQEFNFIADKDDCVLLPESERGYVKWDVPRSRHNGYSYGFGQSNVWYAQGVEEKSNLKGFLEKLLNEINSYNEENWIDKEVDFDETV
ncbi:MAG: hypothetical protein ACI4V4_03795 [Eubacterium sp.]